MLTLVSVLMMAVPVDDRVWVSIDESAIKVGKSYTIGVPSLSVEYAENVPVPTNDKHMKQVQDACDSSMSDKQLFDWLSRHVAEGKSYAVKPGTNIRVLQIKPATKTLDVVFLNGRHKGKKAVVTFRTLCEPQ